MKTGRPTKYDPAFIVIAREYIDNCNREQTELPTIEGLALIIGVDTDSIDNWAKQYVDFFGAIKDLKSKQKNQLINDGLYGGKEVNQAMAIFLLKANHGLKESSNLDVTSGGKPLPQPILDVRQNTSNKETPGTE